MRLSRTDEERDGCNKEATEDERAKLHGKSHHYERVMIVAALAKPRDPGPMLPACRFAILA